MGESTRPNFVGEDQEFESVESSHGFFQSFRNRAIPFVVVSMTPTVSRRTTRQYPVENGDCCSISILLVRQQAKTVSYVWFWKKLERRMSSSAHKTDLFQETMSGYRGENDDSESSIDETEDHDEDHDGNSLSDDDSIQRELSEELDRQMEEMIDDTRRQIEDELQRQIDDQLREDYDKQMEEYFFKQEQEEQLQEWLQQNLETKEPPKTTITKTTIEDETTVADINSQIEQVIDQYRKTHVHEN